MNRSRNQRALKLFEQSLDLPSEQVASFLDQACGDDDRLRAEVESLLATYHDVDKVLPTTDQHHPSTISGVDDAKVFRRTKTGDDRLEPGLLLLDRYAIEASIGTGGMGEVYRATDCHLDRIVAIKVLPFASLRNDELHKRFVREAKSVAALSHPNVMALHDIASDGEVQFAVMEYVEGKTMREVMANSVDVPTAIKLAHGIASGLSAAHSRNIMHRDIKPENIIVTPNGCAKVLDFGLARYEALPADQSLTATSVSPGTVPYMSPEQIESGKLTCSTDIFSLGTVLFEAITGTHPFRSATAFQTMQRVSKADPPPITDFVSDIPYELSSLVMSMLRRQPEQRPTALEAVEFLDRLQQSLRDRKQPSTHDHISISSENQRPPDTGRSGGDTIPQASLAVLPFQVFGEQSELGSLADGLVENLTTILTRVPLLSLASRSSCFALSGKSLTADQVRQILGVRYMLEGSIQDLAGKVRASVQLIDTTNGFQLWAQQFDSPRDANAVSKLLHDILPRLETQLVRAISKDLQSGGEELSSRQLVLQAMSVLSLKGWHESSFTEAAALLRRSIKLDPDFAMSHAYLSLVIGLGHRVGLLRDSDRVIPEAIAEASLALELDDLDSNVLGLVGCALADVGQIDRAIPILKNAVDFNPNNAQAQTALGSAYFLQGRLDEAIEQLSLGIKISPSDSRLSIWNGFLALAYLQRDDLDQALAAALVGCQANQRTYMPRIALTAVRLMRGEREEATKALAECYRVKPDLSNHAINSLVGRELGIAIQRLGVRPSQDDGGS